MRMDNAVSFQHPSVSGTKSIRPHLAYELDRVRKAAKKGSQGKCVDPLEEIAADNQKKHDALTLANRETIDHRLDK